MKISYILKAGLSVLALLMFLAEGGSQVVVERSKEKLIISGTPYYIHTVRKGETAYSISKAYNITVEDLTKENPPALYGLNEGQALRIPIRQPSEVIIQQSQPAQALRDETRFAYHKLQAGETVYALSKMYGVSENAIVSANPGIDISKLSIGAEIAVPKKDFRTERENFAVQEKNYIFHKVVRGESLSSIADRYDISLRELRRENRDVRFPQVGDYLRIPVVQPVSQDKIADEMSDTLKVATDLPVVLFDRPAEYTRVMKLRGSLDVAVMLPLYLSENASRTYIDSSRILKGKRISRVISYPEEWIYNRSLAFIEMYEGILIAADTLRSLGLDVTLHVFDIKNDTLEITRLIKRGSLSGMDLIIGPVYSHNLAIMSKYARERGIPVVSPVSLMNNSVLINNPNLFMANSTLEVAQNTIAMKVSEYYDRNFVFVHNDTAGRDSDVAKFKYKILNELSNRLPFEEIKFREFFYFSRSAFGNDSINRLGHALSLNSENIIIIASEDGPVISETLQEIHALTKKYQLKVFGYPALRGLDNLDPRYLFDLDVMIYSPYWINYSARDVIRFNSLFRQKFLTEPDELSYSWLGYDIAYYFLSGLAMHGKDFMEHPEIHHPDLLHTDFDFRRKSMNDGYENHKLFPVMYTRDYKVVLGSEFPGTE